MIIGLSLDVWERWPGRKECGDRWPEGFCVWARTRIWKKYLKNTEVGEDNIRVLPWVLAELK